MKAKLKRFLAYLTVFLMVMTGLDYYRRPNGQAFQEALVGLNGEIVDFQERTLVYFWGEWCGYCRLVSPMMANLNLPVVSIAIGSGTANEVKNYLKSKNYSFITVNDPDGKIAERFQIKATPTIAIVQNGELQHSTSGLTSAWGIRLRWWLF